jgi:hypothetical protein
MSMANPTLFLTVTPESNRKLSRVNLIQDFRQPYCKGACRNDFVWLWFLIEANLGVR